MKIKEQDEQHMVIGPTLGEQLYSTFAFVFGIVFFIVAQFIPNILGRVLFSIFGVVAILAFLRLLIGTRTVIDKPTQTVTISKRSFFLTSRQHVIPFSNVRSVVIDYDAKPSGDGGAGDSWKFSLDIDGKKYEIGRTTKKAHIPDLAGEISRFIGKELVDNSAKSEISIEGLKRGIKRTFRKGRD